MSLSTVDQFRIPVTRTLNALSHSVTLIWLSSHIKTGNYYVYSSLLLALAIFLFFFVFFFYFFYFFCANYLERILL